MASKIFAVDPKQTVVQQLDAALAHIGTLNADATAAEQLLNESIGKVATLESAAKESAKVISAKDTEIAALKTSQADFDAKVKTAAESMAQTKANEIAAVKAQEIAATQGIPPLTIKPQALPEQTPDPIKELHGIDKAEACFKRDSAAKVARK